MESTTQAELVSQEQTMVSLEQELTSTDNPKRGNLWKAWHFLQVYATWGLKLPFTDKSLKAYLDINDGSIYSFYGTMLEANQEINKSSINFNTNVFPAVVKCGNSLRSFAEENRSTADNVWDLIIELLEDKTNYPDILELVSDLQDRAAKNVVEAGKVAELLGGYNAQLNVASGKLKLALDRVEADDKTSSSAIEKLQGGPNVMGSLKQIQKLATEQKKAYDKNVVIAATTPTYGWFPIFGQIAAATVAGIYGSAAVKSLKAYNGAMKELKKSQSALKTAIKAHEVQNLAEVGISNAKRQTELAIQNIVVVQNAWAALAGNLDTVKLKLDAMTKDNEGAEELKGKRLVARYANQAKAAWDNLWPSVKELTEDPYIKVDTKDKTVDNLISEIETSLANPALSN